MNSSDILMYLLQYVNVSLCYELYFQKIVFKFIEKNILTWLSFGCPFSSYTISTSRIKTSLDFMFVNLSVPEENTVYERQTMVEGMQTKICLLGKIRMYFLMIYLLVQIHFGFRPFRFFARLILL